MCHVTLHTARHTYAMNAHIFISLFLSVCEGFTTDLSHSLQAIPRMVSGCGEAGLQLKPRSRSGLARPGPAWPSPVQPTTTSAVSLEPPRLLSSIANRGGNVSLGVDQETSMPKQGASCPDTALPVGYVRTFLPFTLSRICVSLPLLWLAALRQAASEQWFVFFPLCVHSGGVEACVSACVDAFCHYSTAAQPK